MFMKLGFQWQGTTVFETWVWLHETTFPFSRVFLVQTDFHSSTFAGDNSTMRNDEEASAQAGAWNVSFGWRIHLRTPPCGRWCQTEPGTDCDHSCCLALQGQTSPHWGSRMRDKEQLGGTEAEHSAHHTHHNPQAKEKSSYTVICGLWLKSLIHTSCCDPQANIVTVPQQSFRQFLLYLHTPNIIIIIANDPLQFYSRKISHFHSIW